MDKTFRFKQFEVFHEHSTLKVGTDAVLLGAWAETENTDSILEIGTGCGIISLMLAQRSSAKITAIEIDENSVAEAHKNINLSKWKNRIEIKHINLQSFASLDISLFDLIVSNPPFFNNSLKSKNPVKNLAKHTHNLTHEVLLFCTNKLLNNKGKACFIIPYTDYKIFTEIALINNLYCTAVTEIIPVTGKFPNRVLLKFEKIQKVLSNNSLVIRDINNEYTEDYKKITKDFYIKF